MAKQFNLREFQTNLSRQLQAAANRDTSTSRLGFRVGNDNWLVSLSDAEEVIPVPSIVPVPGAQPWFRGVANIRGRLFAVSDFAHFMGMGATPAHSNCRVLIPHHDFGVNAALIVSSTLGLKNISQFAAQEQGATHSWVSRHYHDDTGTPWNDLDFGSLLGNANFMQVETQLNS
ncbi:MAG: chemotaxis protein CheW [Thiobacillus sp.]